MFYSYMIKRWINTATYKGIEPKRRHQPKLLKTHGFFHPPLPTYFSKPQWFQALGVRRDLCDSREHLVLWFRAFTRPPARNPAKRQGKQIFKARMTGAPSNSPLYIAIPVPTLCHFPKKTFKSMKSLRKKTLWRFVKIQLIDIIDKILFNDFNKLQGVTFFVSWGVTRFVTRITPKVQSVIIFNSYTMTEMS